MNFYIIGNQGVNDLTALPIPGISTTERTSLMETTAFETIPLATSFETSQTETTTETLSTTLTTLETLETSTKEPTDTTELESIPLFTTSTFYGTEQMIYQKFPYAPSPENATENSGPECIHCDAKNWDACRKVGKYARCNEGEDSKSKE